MQQEIVKTKISLFIRLRSYRNFARVAEYFKRLGRPPSILSARRMSKHFIDMFHILVCEKSGPVVPALLVYPSAAADTPLPVIRAAGERQLHTVVEQALEDDDEASLRAGCLPASIDFRERNRSLVNKKKQEALNALDYVRGKELL